MRWLGIAGLVVVSTTAYADEIATADALFAKAQALRAAGQVNEACDAFSESLAHNPNAIGTILNVARCAEEAGKLASAVRSFSEARDRAREQRLKPEQQVAEQHLASLVARTPHLSIKFIVPPPRDTRLVVADREVDLATASDILVDPGTVRVVVSAPGHVPYATAIEIEVQVQKVIAVPTLRLPATNTQRTIAKGMVGIGAAVAVTGEIVGLLARRKYRDAISQCSAAGDNYTCDLAEYSNIKDAVTLGDVGTGTTVSGLILAGSGALLWWFAPRSDAPHDVAFFPSLAPDSAGLAAAGRF